MKYAYQPQGTCSRLISIDVDESGYIRQVAFVGGCHGNTQGICALVRGIKADDVVGRLKGIRCGNKPTSCPDQLATALENILRK